MKILYLTLEDMNLSRGAAVHVREVVYRLRNMGCEVTLVASGDPHGKGIPTFVSFRESLRPEGGIGRGISLIWGLIRLFFLAGRLLPSHDPIYARDYHVASVCVLLKVFLRRRLIYEINGMSSEEWLMKGDTIIHRVVAMMIRGFERLAVRYADRIVAVTDGLRRYLISNFGVDGRKISVIPNGVDTKRFCPMAGADSVINLRTCLGTHRSVPTVLFAGNLAHWQGISTLLDSVPLVLKKVPQVKFLIVGDGILRQYLQEKAREMNLGETVLFTGMVPHGQIPVYINLVDVCVSPFVKKRNNRIGVSPLKIYEYMACGKAVVSSRVAGLEFIGQKGVGVLVEPEDPEALAEGIVSLLLDPTKRAWMGRKGARLARQEFDWEKRASETLEMLADGWRIP